VRWRAGHEPRPFDPDLWLRTRAAEEVDLADIGALAVPTPSLAHLNATIQAHYGSLRELDPEERQLDATREQNRHLALRLLNDLPGACLASLGLYKLSRAPAAVAAHQQGDRARWPPWAGTQSLTRHRALKLSRCSQTEQPRAGNGVQTVAVGRCRSSRPSDFLVLDSTVGLLGSS